MPQISAWSVDVVACRCTDNFSSGLVPFQSHAMRSSSESWPILISRLSMWAEACSFLLQMSQSNSEEKSRAISTMHNKIFSDRLNFFWKIFMELPFPTFIVCELITDYRLAASEIPGSLAEVLKFRITDLQLPLPTLIFWNQLRCPCP